MKIQRVSKKGGAGARRFWKERQANFKNIVPGITPMKAESGIDITMSFEILKDCGFK